MFIIIQYQIVGILLFFYTNMVSPFSATTDWMAEVISGLAKADINTKEYKNKKRNKREMFFMTSVLYRVKNHFCFLYVSSCETTVLKHMELPNCFIQLKFLENGKNLQGIYKNMFMPVIDQYLSGGVFQT